MVIVLHSGRYTYNVVALLARCEQRRLIMHYKHRMPMPYNIILSSTHYIIIWCEFHHIETAIAATVIITFKIIITIIIFYMYTLKYYVLALWPRSQSIISLSTIMLNAFCVMVCFSFRPTVAAVTLSLTLSRALSLHLSVFFLMVRPQKQARSGKRFRYLFPSRLHCSRVSLFQVPPKMFTAKSYGLVKME